MAGHQGNAPRLSASKAALLLLQQWPTKVRDIYYAHPLSLGFPFAPMGEAWFIIHKPNKDAIFIHLMGTGWI